MNKLYDIIKYGREQTPITIVVILLFILGAYIFIKNSGNYNFFGKAQIANQSPAINDGNLITTSKSPDIYIVKIATTKDAENKKFKRLILNADIFNSYEHLRWEDVKTVSEDIVNEYKLSEFVIEVNADGSVTDPKVYKISSAPDSDVGERRWLNITSKEFETLGYDWSSIFYINHTEASPDFYPTKDELTYAQLAPKDTQRPIISDIKESGVLKKSATISWNTDEESESIVYYGLATSALDIFSTASSKKSEAGFQNIAKLSGLEEEEKYFYKVTSQDSSNNKSESEIMTFTLTDCDAEVPSTNSTIQKAVDAASFDDKICVLEGTYNENVTIDGKNIRLSGASNDKTTIKAVRGSESPDLENSNPTSAITIKNVGSGAEIRNFTISNGNYYGLWIEDASPLIKNNIIKDNYAGVRVLGVSRPSIEDNLIVNNKHGSAITHNGDVGSYAIDHNTFSNNGNGGESDTLLFDSEFPTTAITISNNIIADGFRGIHTPRPANILIKYNLLYNHTRTLYRKEITNYNSISSLNNLSSANNNIQTNPLLYEDYRPRGTSPVINSDESGKGNIGAY